MNKIMDELIKLKQENPDLEIIPMTHHEVICDDEHKYWGGNFKEVKIDLYYEEVDGNVFFGEVAILDKIEDMAVDEIETFCDDYDYDKNIEKYSLNKFEEMLKSNKIKKAIFIYIGV